MKELTCIVCPRGCKLLIDDNLNVSGNFCPRGPIWAKEELTDPKRTLTTSIRVINRKFTLVSVKTNKPISKNLMFKAMKIINKCYIEAPAHIGDIVIKNILDTGCDVIITKEIK